MAEPKKLTKAESGAGAPDLSGAAPNLLARADLAIQRLRGVRHTLASVRAREAEVNPPDLGGKLDLVLDLLGEIDATLGRRAP